MQTDMKEKQNEPSLDEIVPERDDFGPIHAHRASNSRSLEESSRASGGSSSIILFLALIAALGSAGASYWLFTQSRTQQSELLAAQARISDLEKRLSATGEEMDQSAVAMQVKVTELAKKTDELWEQMDKLWASAWRRNQTEIKELSELVTKHKTSGDGRFGEITNDVKSVQSSLDTFSINVDILKEQLDSYQKSTSALSSKLDKASQSSQTSQQQIDQLKNQINQLSSANQSLRARVSTLENTRSVPEIKTP